MKESEPTGVEPGMTPALTAPPARRVDPDAFVAMVGEHDRLLRALVYRLVEDRDRMDDVLQEVYLKAFRALPGFRGEAGLGTWLYRIAYNVCMDELRRAGRWQPLPIDEAVDLPDAAPDPADVASLRGDLAAALASLPPEQRAAVLLVDLNGLDYAAAAEVLGIAAGTVGSRVSRARAALRLTLRPEGDTR